MAKAKKWTLQEKKYVEYHHDKLSVEQMATYLGRSVYQVRKYTLGIKGRKPPPKKTTNANAAYRGGYRPHLGFSVRSSWENDVLLWLSYHGIAYEYEPKLFQFFDIRRGTTSYLPDIWIPKSEYKKLQAISLVPIFNQDHYIEVKGRTYSNTSIKTRRFQKFYPKEAKTLLAIVGGPKTEAAKLYDQLGVPIIAHFGDLKREYKNVITNWESK